MTQRQTVGYPIARHSINLCLLSFLKDNRIFDKNKTKHAAQNER